MKISVVVNNFNYGRFLAEALERALEQLGSEDELIVVDDGSTDESREVLAEYADHPQMRVFEQPNQGQLGTMLDGLQAARGDLQLLLDSDDFYLPGYLGRVRALAEAHPEVDLFFSAAQPGGDCPPARIDAMNAMLARMELEAGPTGPSRWTTLYTGEFIGTPTTGIALRRNLVERILRIRGQLDDRLRLGTHISALLRLPVDSHAVRRISGDGLLLRGAGALGSIKYYDPRPAFYYRIHGTNAYARINRLGRLYMRLKRGRQVAGLLRGALEIEKPAVADVVDEARTRSRPLRRRRRVRVTMNYIYTALRARGGPAAKVGALVIIPRVIFRDSPGAAESSPQA